jgi:hypothetical protein
MSRLIDDRKVATDFRESYEQDLSDEKLIAAIVRVLSRPSGISRRHVSEFYRIIKRELEE